MIDLAFSFDSILSALALTDVFAVMATAVLMGGALRSWLADRAAGFFERNRMYKVLGPFSLFIVGIMLLSEGGHLAHLSLLDHPVEPMAASTCYLVITVLALLVLVRGRCQKKTLAQARAERTTTVRTPLAFRTRPDPQRAKRAQGRAARSNHPPGAAIDTPSTTTSEG